MFTDDTPHPNSNKSLWQQMLSRPTVQTLHNKLPQPHTTDMPLWQQGLTRPRTQDWPGAQPQVSLMAKREGDCGKVTQSGTQESGASSGGGKEGDDEKGKRHLPPTGHGYYKEPENLPAFPEATLARRKTPRQGGGGLRKRWEDKRSIYEFDTQHGRVEKYRKSDGKHLGEFDYMTGEQTKPADPTKKIIR